MPKLAAVALVLALAAGCAGRQKMPPIPDTPDAKAVLAVLESYRKAMEAKDVPGILAVVSPDYHDDMGTPEAGDDLTYDDLKRKLSKDLAHLKTLRLEIDVLKLRFTDKEQVAKVEYRYDLRFQTHMPSGDTWHNALDVKRMVLRREGRSWKVVAGL